MVFRDDQSSLGEFLYPPNDNSLTFNYRDTVNVSWTTFNATASTGFLSLWYWPGEGRWLLSLNTSVSLNGSKSVPLSIASKWYYGQFNMNYALDNGSDGKYLSEFFNVDHDSSQSPVTWPGASNSKVSLKPEQSTTAVTTLSSSTSQASLKSEQSTTAVTTLSSSQPASPSPQIDSTPSSTPSTSGLKGGAVAGVSVGSIVCLSLLILTAILFIRRSRRNRRSHAAKSGMLTRAELGVPPAAFSSSRAATELAGNGEEWRELSAEQTGPRELPTTEFKMATPELSANRI